MCFDRRGTDRRLFEDYVGDRLVFCRLKVGAEFDVVIHPIDDVGPIGILELVELVGDLGDNVLGKRYRNVTSVFVT